MTQVGWGVGWAGEGLHPTLICAFIIFLPPNSGVQQHHYLESFQKFRVPGSHPWLGEPEEAKSFLADASLRTQSTEELGEAAAFSECEAECSLLMV